MLVRAWAWFNIQQKLERSVAMVSLIPRSLHIRCSQYKLRPGNEAVGRWNLGTEGLKPVVMQ